MCELYVSRLPLLRPIQNILPVFIYLLLIALCILTIAIMITHIMLLNHASVHIPIVDLIALCILTIAIMITHLMLLIINIIRHDQCFYWFNYVLRTRDILPICILTSARPPLHHEVCI